LFDGALQASFDQVSRFGPAEEAEHHDPRENDGARIDHVFVSILWRRTVRGFKNRVAIAHIGSGSDAQATNLRSASVGNVVAIKVWRRKHAIFVGASHNLLEDRVGDAIVDEEFFLPGALAVRCVDGVEAVFYFFVDRLPEVFLSKLESGFDEVGVLLDGEIGIFVFVVQDPALALRDNLAAELLGRKLVAPLAERAFRELLDVALVNARDGLVFVFEGVLDCHAH